MYMGNTQFGFPYKYICCLMEKGPGGMLWNHMAQLKYTKNTFLFSRKKKNLTKKIAKVHRTGLMHDNMCGEVTYWKLLWAVNKSLSWGPGTTKWGRQYGQTVQEVID